MNKKYIGFARVSSREQEREGFSLDVQEEAFEYFAKSKKGVVDKVFRIAETATKAEQRKVFREAIAFAKQNASEYDGMLFYKIDRAARNMKDFMLLEDIEEAYDLPIISVTQPTENSPTGRMIRRTLATIGAFQTEQQSLDIQSGIAKRVALGWFPSRCPYGYRNVRHDGRATAEVHPEDAAKVQRAGELRIYEHLSPEMIAERLYEEGLFYADSKPRFSPSKLYDILTDLSYIGFVWYRGKWHPGQHKPLFDKVTWELLQQSFGLRLYRAHDKTYANELIYCGFCGHFVTCEVKPRTTKAGLVEYRYYRCARYQRPGHPRIRLKEEELELQARQLLVSFRAFRPDMQQLLVNAAVDRLRQDRASSEFRSEEAKRQLALIDGQRDELLNLRLAKSIPEEKFSSKQAELLERETAIRRQIQTVAELRTHDDTLAARAPVVFEHVQQGWDSLARTSKHEILRLLFGEFVLDGRVLVPKNGTPLELFSASTPSAVA